MSVWITIYRLSWGVLVLLILVAGASLFSPQIKQYRENQRKKAELEESIREEEKIISQLKRQQERLQFDPAFVEKIAREELRLSKPGETVFRFAEEEQAEVQTGPGEN